MAVQVCSGQSNINFNFSEVGTIAFSTTGVYPANPIATPAWNFVNTTAGALGVDTIHAKQYTLASTTSVLDLFGGSLLSPSGAACVFARVRVFCLAVVSTTAGFLMQVYSSASNAPLWLPPIANLQWATPNGGIFLLFDPNAITTQGYLVDTSHKSIVLNSASNTVAANLLIMGNSSAS